MDKAITVLCLKEGCQRFSKKIPHTLPALGPEECAGRRTLTQFGLHSLSGEAYIHNTKNPALQKTGLIFHGWFWLKILIHIYIEIIIAFFDIEFFMFF
jgi:hypothetical protein